MTGPTQPYFVSSLPAAQASPALELPEEYNAAAAFVDGALAAGWGARIALRSPAGEWTYAQLAEQVNRAGNALQSLGVEMEQRVAILLYDSPEFAAAFFGAIKIGAVTVPLNTQLRVQDYLYMLNDSRAVALIVEEDLWAQLAPRREELRFLRHALLVRRGAADGNPSLGGGDFSALLSQAANNLTSAPTSRDDAALWLYSSGSTGFPKGCVHLQHDMYCCVEQYAKPILNLTPDDVTFSAAKLYFAYGLGNGLYFPLSSARAPSTFLVA